MKEREIENERERERERASRALNKRRDRARRNKSRQRLRGNGIIQLETICAIDSRARVDRHCLHALIEKYEFIRSKRIMTGRYGGLPADKRALHVTCINLRFCRFDRTYETHVIERRTLLTFECRCDTFLSHQIFRCESVVDLRITAFSDYTVRYGTS